MTPFRVRTTLLAAALAIACGIPLLSRSAPNPEASPIYGVTLPRDYRKWELIAPAVEAAPLDELRVVAGNRIAVRAYAKQELPFPDGTVFVKMAWKRVASPVFAPASIPGAATTVQVMVKDSKKYASTGGWGFGKFVNGQPVEEAQHRTCFSCHAARVKAHARILAETPR